MYWIELRPVWLTVPSGKYSHVSVGLHRWTLGINYEDALKLTHVIEASGFGDVKLDDASGRLPRLIVTPKITQLEPAEGGTVPSMSQRLESIIDDFIGDE